MGANLGVSTIEAVERRPALLAALALEPSGRRSLLRRQTTGCSIRPQVVIDLARLRGRGADRNCRQSAKTCSTFDKAAELSAAIASS